MSAVLDCTEENITIKEEPAQAPAPAPKQKNKPKKEKTVKIQTPPPPPPPKVNKSSKIEVTVYYQDGLAQWAEMGLTVLPDEPSEADLLRCILDALGADRLQSLRKVFMCKTETDPGLPWWTENTRTIMIKHPSQ